MLLRTTALITGLGLAARALSIGWADWPTAALGILLAVSGLFADRSLGHAVVARAAAAAVLVPKLYVVGAFLVYRHLPPLSVALLAGGAAAGVWLTRPLLDAPAAKAAFDPVAHRTSFLAGATGLVATALVTPLDMIHMLASFALLACAWGVLRMRAWGVLLGVFVAEMVVLHAAVTHHHPQATLGLIASALLVLPLVRARLIPERRMRIGEQAQARVAVGDELEVSACSESLHDSGERAVAG